MKNKLIIFNVVAPFLIVIGILFATIISKKENISEVEKRKLAELPQLTMKNWLNGVFANRVEDYLSDHVVYRNRFISLSDNCKEFYNFRFFSPLNPEPEGILVKIQSPQKSRTTKVNSPLDNEINRSELLLDTNQELVSTEGIYIYDSCAYQFFGGSKNSATRYVKSVNAIKANLSDSIVVYSLIVPSSTEFSLPKEKYKGKSTSEEANINLVYSKLSPKVLTTSVYKRLANHNREYLYFKTDHHWTARGAYYAYLEFSAVAGFDVTPITEMKPTFMKSTFLGSLYALTRHSSLKGNPDRVEYFDKNFQGASAYFKMKPTDNWKKTQIVNKKGEYGIGYGVFLGIDYPVMKINGLVKNGRTLLVIKDSYANAFIPFLVSHFEKIYVADIRYFPYKITNFVKENRVNEVLIMNHIVTANSPFTSNKLNKLIK